MRIEGSVIVVTGASSGIGEATARLAHQRGARVVLAARRADRLEALAAALPGSLGAPTDVTDPAAVDALVRACVDAFGRVDVLVNNAGQGLHVPIEQVRLDDLRAVFELNVVAPIALTQAVLPLMRAQGGGSIVNVSSGTTRRLPVGIGPYAATKSALNTVTDVARAELAAYGIAVSLVIPSITATEFHSVLRAGVAHIEGLPRSAPSQVAEAILRAIDTGEPEIVVAPSGP